MELSKSSGHEFVFPRLRSVLVDPNLFPSFAHEFTFLGTQSGLVSSSEPDVVDAFGEEERFYSPDSNFSLDEIEVLDLNSTPPTSDTEKVQILKSRKSLSKIRQERCSRAQV